MNTHVVICFFGANQHQYYSHCQMRTRPLFRELNKYFSYCFFNANDSIIKKFPYKRFFIIRIKSYTIPKAFLELKNKTIFWDIIDTLQHCTPDNLFKTPRFLQGYKESDIINCPNSEMKKIILSNNNLKKEIVMIPHNWDSRVENLFTLAKKNESLEKPVIAYLGTPNSQQEQQCIQKSPFVVNLGRVINKNHIGTFNVCCSLRNKNVAFGKPGTKSFVASSLNSLIIASKEEYGVVDLYGNDYPYYLKNNKKTLSENLEETINYIVSTYNTDIWKNAKLISNNVREKTSINAISLEIKNIILKYI